MRSLATTCCSKSRQTTTGQRTTFFDFSELAFRDRMSSEMGTTKMAARTFIDIQWRHGTPINERGKRLIGNVVKRINRR